MMTRIMRMIIRTKTILSIALLFVFANITFGEYLNFFSPKDDINYNIIRAIDNTDETIDMAITDIKSKQIADAFVLAQNRGVSIRILLSNKKLISNNSQMKYLLENGIKAWVLEDTGIHVNNFAIFDKRLLLGGSFYMDQRKYQNSTFTDDKDILRDYQTRFDGFANLKLSLARNTFFKDSFDNRFEEPKPQKWDTGDTKRWDENFLPTEKDVPGRMIDLSFTEMYNLFGKGSKLSKSEKKELWADYKGKYVTWTGKISYVAWGLMTGNIVGVVHDGSHEVTVNIKDAYVTHVKRLHKGDTLTYRGRLVKKPSMFTGFKIREGEILIR